MSEKLTVVYGDIYLDWQLGAGDGTQPTNPIRAKIATELLQARLGDEVSVFEPLEAGNETLGRAEVIAALKSIHDSDYVDRTLAGNCSQWIGTKPSVAEAGLAMFAGTMLATKQIIDGAAKVAFNPQGAKHHAKKSSAEGFCAFNDMAWAAIEFQRAGLKPLYLDFDIHAGDGVFHMLKDSGVPTISIHNGSIYPWDSEMQAGGGVRTEFHDRQAHNYNFNVAMGDGDDAFIWAMDAAAEIINSYQPDVILLAAGADGHTGSSRLGQSNNYTEVGFRHAAEVVATMASKHAEGRVLIGGAGGYQPLKETPETWALVVETIFKEIAADASATELVAGAK
ncbi:MAG: acetoin utilization protein AcuC [Actinomycetota bacterium]